MIIKGLAELAAEVLAAEVPAAEAPEAPAEPAPEDGRDAQLERIMGKFARLTPAKQEFVLGYVEGLLASKQADVLECEPAEPEAAQTGAR
jgi:hypothetical protein